MNEYYKRCKETGELQLIELEDGRIVYDISKFPNYIKEYEHWHLVEATFPYNRVAEVHHMLIAKRIYASSQEMTIHERAELEDIKLRVGDSYHCMLENLDAGKSILGHHHLHLVKWKGETVRPGGILNDEK
jgi:hypothetical protein